MVQCVKGLVWSTKSNPTKDPQNTTSCVLAVSEMKPAPNSPTMGRIYCVLQPAKAHKPKKRALDKAKTYYKEQTERVSTTCATPRTTQASIMRPSSHQALPLSSRRPIPSLSLAQLQNSVTRSYLPPTMVLRAYAPVLRQRINRYVTK